MRVYGEVIDVRTDVRTEAGAGVGAGAGRFGAPAQFLWRGRVYLVRDVLAQWIELGNWWSVRGGSMSPGSDVRSTRQSDQSVAAAVRAVECEVWRVEAARGRNASPGVYDLVHEVPAHDWGRPDVDVGRGHDRWRLARALD